MLRQVNIFDIIVAIFCEMQVILSIVLALQNQAASLLQHPIQMGDRSTLWA